ncbi:DUF4031 domain-containing protein [Streptomyces sp. SCSIO ZS0520]|uniref:DUF4031 domain-containing protein n=1 Tax=Streptomyces sp. SCSIO ZS0520 TaxID=2892996 RepID=UPI0021D9094B|nr:DUF4031 domain-containing protein [Streptomyces sp. SCSIO ZS0520]
MTLYIDPPTWPGHGRLWSHLVSDVSYEELHAFAARIGAPPRAFERDHYDIPAHHYREAVAAGAVEVSSREVVRLLTRAGLRRRKRSGGLPVEERSLGERPVGERPLGERPLGERSVEERSAGDR